jgi:hypothetical protein
MVGFDPSPVNREPAGLPHGAAARQTTSSEVKALITLIASAAAVALLLGGFWLRERLWRRRPRLLAEVMDEADALERELYECRTRLREIPALVATLPPSAQLSARATLVAEPQVQAALRDLLSHRLWLKEHAANATLAELKSAHGALAAAKAALVTQLERLAEVRAELEAARGGQMVRSADAHS